MTAPASSSASSGTAAPSPSGPTVERDPGSWRDPAGFVYTRDGQLLRQVQRSFADDWDRFIGSGLYERLVSDGLLVAHEDVAVELAAAPGAHRVIRPEPIALITYPWEWSFSQLKDAALLTLAAQLAALEAGMTLRDASAFNVQFRGGRPVLIDSLSFERAEPGAPWSPYRQFCEHFLAPLALMARVDVRLGGLLEAHLDGIPLDLAAELLPGRSRFSLGLGPHIHLHARSQKRHADDMAKAPSPPAGDPPKGGGQLSPERLRTLIESLRQTVEGLRWEPSGTEWADYADHTSYDDAATRAKAAAVADAVSVAAAAGKGRRRAWDLGANTGRYSRIAADAGYSVVALDIDPAAVERGYLAIRREGRQDIMPLLGDVADPTPARGWALRERRSLLERIDADVILALALVHHLAIGRNVPLPMIADVFADLGSDLVIEFVPREDAMAQRLLAARRDIFGDYTEDGFTAAFGRQFETVSRVPIEGTSRTLHHLRRRSGRDGGTT